MTAVTASTVGDWHDIARERIVPLTFEQTEKRFRARFEQRRLANGLSLHTLATTGLIVTRSERQARRESTDDVLVVVQKASSGTLTQGDRSVLLVPRSVALVDPRRTYAFDHSAGAQRQLTLRVPRARLDVDDRTITASCAASLPPHHAPALMMGGYLRALWSDAPAMASHEASAAADLAVDLVGSLLRGWGSQGEDRAGAVIARLRRHIDEHLDDADLSVPTLAAAHHMSVRAVYDAFAKTGETPAAFIRRRRLRRASTLLRDEAELSIADVAIRCGFGDPMTFSRAFRREFSTSPSAWRGARR